MRLWLDDHIKIKTRCCVVWFGLIGQLDETNAGLLVDVEMRRGDEGFS